MILPIVAPGIAATALMCVIFAWNEYFYAIQLNFAGALDDAAVGDRKRLDARQLPREAVGGIDDRVPARSSSPAGWPRSG